MASSIDPGRVAERVRTLRNRILQLGGERVAVVAVTKGHPVGAWVAAAEAGCEAVGENYAQELAAKILQCPRRTAPLPVHFIGSVQSNKVRLIADVVDLWQGVDRVSVATEIARRHALSGAGSARPAARVLLQVDTTGEATKSGCPPGDLGALLTASRAAGVEVVGLMTIGPTGGDRQARRESFGLLRRLVDEHGLGICSMGMSEDYEDAVECGSTMVRIGSALFGPRT